MKTTTHKCDKCNGIINPDDDAHFHNPQMTTSVKGEADDLFISFTGDLCENCRMSLAHAVDTWRVTTLAPCGKAADPWRCYAEATR